AKLVWQDGDGRQCPCDVPAAIGQGSPPMMEMEYPATHALRPDGWTEVSDTYRAPGRATKVTVQLNLQWVPDARVAWSRVELVEVPPPPARIVRLAAAHLRPWAGDP